MALNLLKNGVFFSFSDFREHITISDCDIELVKELEFSLISKDYIFTSVPDLNNSANWNILRYFH